MPIVKADRLTRVSAVLLRAAGASEEEADAVAIGCVNANLAGHDSHGVIAVPTYIDRIKAGHIVPGAKWSIVRESPTTTVIDGHWGFGFHVNAKAMALTIEKAKTANVAACTVFRQSHVGRLAAYPLMAMREGMIGIATADSGRSPKHVAPFGGKEARLGTNPISIAVPSDLDAPFYLDMATSAVAAGKIQLAVARGEEIPTGWIIDAEGRHTPPIRPNTARAGPCCRSAAPRATRAAASPPWSRSFAACSPASASASSRRDGTMTAASWRCSTSQRSAR
ncbi:LDH2 family malate/lactate/ureidoglycolate dehydrogenase [Bradyrhizobium sp. LM6.11]